MTAAGETNVSSVANIETTQTKDVMVTTMEVMLPVHGTEAGETTWPISTCHSRYTGGHFMKQKSFWKSFCCRTQLEVMMTFMQFLI